MSEWPCSDTFVNLMMVIPMPDPVSIAVGAAAIVAVDGGREFFKRIAGKLGDDVGEVVSEVTTFRMRNLAQTMRRARQLTEAAGKDAKPIPPRVLVPMLEGASLEDDHELQERWAALLANAAIAGDDESMLPVFAKILANLTPLSARGLQVLATPRDNRRKLISEPSGASPEEFAKMLGSAVVDDGAAQGLLGRANAIAGLLVREGIVSQTPVLRQSGTYARGEPADVRLQGTELKVSDLGIAFLAACTPPAPSGGNKGSASS